MIQEVEETSLWEKMSITAEVQLKVRDVAQRNTAV